MNKFRISFLISFIGLLNPCVSHAQDYIDTDSARLYGIDLIKGKEHENVRFVKIRSKRSLTFYEQNFANRRDVSSETITNLTPNDILGYGFKGGEYYKAFDIQIDGQKTRLFFEELYHGKLNLYYLSTEKDINKYYITENDSSELIPLPKEEAGYANFFSTYIGGCRHASVNLKHLIPDKTVLAKYFKVFDDCSRVFLPKMKVGLTGGVTSSKFSSTEVGSLLNIPDYENIQGVSLGAFIDVPIKKSNFSIHGELNFTSSNGLTEFVSGGRDYELITTHSYITIPLLIRYNILKFGFVPFFEAGLVYSNPLKNKSRLYEYTVTPDEIFIDINEDPILSDGLMGVSLGSGMIFNYNSKYSMIFQVRYNSLQNLQKLNNSVDLNTLTLQLSLTFH